MSFLGQFAGSWFKRRETAVLLFIATSLPLFFMVGVAWPVEAIPSTLRSFSFIFPSTSAIDGLVRINQMGATLHEVSHDWITSGFWLQFTQGSEPSPAGFWAAAAAPPLPTRDLDASRFLLGLITSAPPASSSIFTVEPSTEAALPIGIARETEIHISTEINARLISIAVKPGQQIHKGELVAVLDSPELSASSIRRRPPKNSHVPIATTYMPACAKKRSTSRPRTSKSQNQMSSSLISNMIAQQHWPSTRLHEQAETG